MPRHMRQGEVDYIGGWADLLHLMCRAPQRMRSQVSVEDDPGSQEGGAIQAIQEARGEVS